MDSPEADSDLPVPELQCLETILRSLDVLVYVSDMQTYEMLYVSDYGRKRWGPVNGRRCYEYLQSGQASACEFCTNRLLVNAAGEPNPVYVWEFQNTVTLRWYECRDQAIRWQDGRLVRLEVAVDITERKEAEHKIEAARREAELLARVDPLTRVGNRRAFFELMKQQLADIQREPRPLSLMMVDIDWFKKVNDSHGHAVGDEVLIGVSQAMAASMRGSDQLFRIGGEEFVVVMPGCDSAGAQELAERIRLMVADMQFTGSDGGRSFGVTCSFGIANHVPGMNADALLAGADAALYAAKSAGRNCVCVLPAAS